MYDIKQEKLENSKGKENYGYRVFKGKIWGIKKTQKGFPFR